MDDAAFVDELFFLVLEGHGEFAVEYSVFDVEGTGQFLL